MKKWWLVAVILMTFKSYGQDQEIQQLILNIEKLSQFKQILADMKTGYEIVSKGYSAIRDVSQGNFSIHKVFLDGLLAVSPVVRNYKKAADIVIYEIALVKEYKAAYNRFKSSGNFSIKELEYVGKVYNNLFSHSLKDIDDLTMVVTANKLRMNDEERLASIDQIYESMRDKLLFLRSFNNQTSVLAFQRAKDALDIKMTRGLMK